MGKTLIIQFKLHVTNSTEVKPMNDETSNTELVALDLSHLLNFVEVTVDCGEVLIDPPFKCANGHEHSYEKYFLIMFIDIQGKGYPCTVPAASPLAQRLLSGEFTDECRKALDGDC